MPETSKIISQDLSSIIKGYLLYRVWLAIMTYGLLAIYDYLAFRNSKLIVGNDKLQIIKSGFSTKEQTLKFNEIASISFNPGISGNIFGYGKLIFTDKYNQEYTFRFVKNAKRYAFLLSEKIKSSNPDILNPTEYEKKIEEDEAKALKEKYDKMGKCPRCGSDKLQGYTSLYGLKGENISVTRRMCTNCGKKFR